ncbi:MAG TPA: nucleotidyltransferase domain-containing protein [Pyrinomonadaceae bacterium]
MNDERIPPVEAALEIFHARHAGARLLFLAGSVMRGEGTPSSDLDLVVVYEHLPNAYRESFIHRGWPVETFVHDTETLGYFLEFDAESGFPSMANMVLEGREIPAPCELSQSLKRAAAELLAAGPPALCDEELRSRRYFLTDHVEDMRHPRGDAELVATGAQMYDMAADFYLRSRGHWSAKGKAIPRRLREVDAPFAARFREAFETLFVEKRSRKVVALVEDVLAPFGGFLFDGYKLDASGDKRKSSGDKQQPSGDVR